jgi:hypothetical protein
MTFGDACTISVVDRHAGRRWGAPRMRFQSWSSEAYNPSAKADNGSSVKPRVRPLLKIAGDPLTIIPDASTSTHYAAKQMPRMRRGAISTCENGTGTFIRIRIGHGGDGKTA